MIDHIRTIWWMSWRRDCWHVRLYWREWRWSALYTWYDGPIYQLWIGPLVLALDCISMKPTKQETPT